MLISSYTRFRVGRQVSDARNQLSRKMFRVRFRTVSAKRHITFSSSCVCFPTPRIKA